MAGVFEPRLLTVVFVDLAGSTALIDRVGDDAGVRAVQHQLGIVRAVSESHGGHEVKSLGDGLLLTFDSPRQAVRFALGAQRLVATSGPGVRIGINTGEVMAAHDDPMGATVNAAARIADRAQAGEVLVADVVRQLVGDLPGVGFADRGRCRLKGFADRWHLFAAVSGGTADAQPTIGRASELVAIDLALTSAANGQGRVVLLEGEAGIGKSHLLTHAIADASRRGFTTLRWDADEVVRRPGALAIALAEDAIEAPDAARRIEELVEGRHAAVGEDTGYALVASACEIVETIAARGRVLLAVEDLHWADDLSLTALVAIARAVPSQSVALVATFRPTPRPELLDRLAQENRSGAASVRLELSSLPAVDVHAIASALTGGAIGTRLGVRLEAAGGNPLYVGELVRTFDDEGCIRVEGGVAELTDDGLPPDLSAMLMRRLHWLSSEDVVLLQVAAVLGSRFSLRDLAIGTGRSTIEVASGLRDALQADLVNGEGEQLRFRHDLIREAIYADLLPGIRMDLHRAVAVAFAAAGAPTARVARQFALGAHPGDIEAVRWLTRAADEALFVDPAEATALLESAIERSRRPAGRTCSGYAPGSSSRSQSPAASTRRSASPTRCSPLNHRRNSSSRLGAGSAQSSGCAETCRPPSTRSTQRRTSTGSPKSNATSSCVSPANSSSSPAAVAQQRRASMRRGR